MTKQISIFLKTCSVGLRKMGPVLKIRTFLADSMKFVISVRSQPMPISSFIVVAVVFLFNN